MMMTRMMRRMRMRMMMMMVRWWWWMIAPWAVAVMDWGEGDSERRACEARSHSDRDQRLRQMRAVRRGGDGRSRK